MTGGVVRREDAHRVLDDGFAIVRLARIELELVLPRARTYGEPELTSLHLGDLALQVELGDVLRHLGDRAGLRLNALDAVGPYAAGAAEELFVKIGKPVVQVWT